MTATRPSAALPAKPATAAPAPAAISIDRLVVHAGGNPTAGARIADRLPATLTAAFAGGAPADRRALRALIERAAREAAR